MKKNYTIIEGNISKLNELIEKINKRARKISQPEISYTVNKEYFKDLNEGLKNQESKIVKLLDITIDAEIIKIDGFDILASINHTYETGNIIKTLSDKEIPIIYQTIDGNCDHCNTKRMRKETVLLQDQQGKIIQVGKSCLKDYLGYSINDKLNYMDLLEEIEKSEVFSMNCGDRFEKYVQVQKILNITNLLIKEYGYIKTRDEDGDTNINNTKERSIKIYSLINPKYWEDKEKEIRDIVDHEKYIDNEVVEAVKWIQEQESNSDYINNLKVLVNNEYIGYKETGILCSLMTCYYKALHKEEAKKAEKAEIKSEYVGIIGDKIQIEVIYKKVFVYETQYGYMKIHLFADAEGHQYKWCSKNSLEQEEGDTLQIKGTIKEHSEYNEIKQTVLTRCKVIQ